MKTTTNLACYPASQRTLDMCIGAVASDYRQFDLVPASLAEGVIRGLAHSSASALVALVENCTIASSLLDEDTCIMIAHTDPYTAVWYLPASCLTVAVGNAIIDTDPDAAAMLPDELLAQLD